MQLDVRNTNTVLNTAAKVGFLPSLAPKDAKKQEEKRPIDTRVPTKEEEAKEKGQLEAQEELRQQAKEQQEGAAQAQRRQISHPTLKFGQENRPSEEKTDFWPDHSKLGENADQPQGPEEKPRPRFDTAGLIQLQYQANQARNPQQSAFSNPAEAALAQKERFLRTFKKLVSIEYNQYCKSDDALYTRKNLREIMCALGEQDSMFAKRMKNDRDDGREVKGYNKLKQRMAIRTLEIFEDSSQQKEEELQREPLMLVA